jgi:CrcB protein
MSAILVAVAGGLGAALRYAVDRGIGPHPGFPWATFAVNVTGSLALGVLVGSTSDADVLHVAGTGLLGGYTTFSAASLDAAERWLAGHRAAGVGSAAAMAVACVAAAALGHAVAR